MTKKCKTCGRILPITEFHSHKGHPDGLQSRCKNCTSNANSNYWHSTLKHDADYKKRKASYDRKWHQENKEKNNQHVRMNHRKQREICIEKYGGKCACCGEARYEFLTIDHILGGGNKHRQEVGNKICRWIIANDFPGGFRILCHNCNQAIAHYGYCPHEVKTEGIATT